jgi:membrane-associated protease RseP (regulator of RpoE activity)
VRDPFDAVDVKAKRIAPIVVAVLIVLVAWGVWSPSGLAAVGVILCLPLIIMLHELAHYVTARRTGMKVTEFFVGFGPRIWSVTRGETEYGIKAVPLGGYCRIVGMTNLEDIAPEDEPRTYRSKSYGAKVLVASAGSLMHFFLAFMLMFLLLAAGGDYWNRAATTTLDGVSGGAAAAGVRAGDKVVEVDGIPIDTWEQVRPALLGEDGTKHEAGDTVPFVVERDGELITTDVTLGTVTDPSTGQEVVVAGVQAGDHVPTFGVGRALIETPKRVGTVMHESVDALGKTFSPSGISDYFRTLAGTSTEDKNGDGQTGDTRFLSPAGFGKVAVDAVDSGWVAVVGLLIMINVFVGLFNLVPLLPFDGGHIAIATYEKLASIVQRRKVQVDVAKLMPLTIAVVAVLGFIFLSSLFLDISRPIANPF